MALSRRSQEAVGSGPALTPDQVRRLEVDGFVILPGVLSEEECDRFSFMIDDIWTRNNFGAIYDGEPGVRFVPNLLQHSAVFERFVTDPLVAAAARAVLGPDFHVSLVNGRRVDPGSGNQPLHDLTRRRGRPFVKCNAIWCLDEFTASNGSTRVLAGSHLADEVFLSRCADPLRPHPDEQLAVAPRGAVILHNSHIIHGGSPNVADTPRRSVHTAFSLRTEPTRYDWTELPLTVRRDLSPQATELLDL